MILCLAFGRSCAAVHAFSFDMSYLLEPVTEQNGGESKLLSFVTHFGGASQALPRGEFCR